LRINLDTVHHLQLGQLRNLFINDAQKNDHLGSFFKDSCLQAEFGYYQQYVNPNNTIRYLKAWLIKPHTDYPNAIYLDSAGVLLGYDNGIRTFR